MMTLNIRIACFVLAISACVLGGCTTYSEVNEKRPFFRPVPVGRGVLANAEAEIEKAQRQDRSRPLGSLDEYLVAAQTSLEQLHRDPNDASAKRDYNFAVGRIFEIIREAKLDPWAKPLAVSGEHGDFVLVHKPDPRPEWNPALYEFTPADQFDVHGKYVTERTVREGIGAPIVAVEREINVNARANFAPSRVFYSVTAVARFEGRHCVLSFEDPLATTIVLVIHGLMDSQATWTPMINTLRGDPVIRRNYQFWFYSYPSGYPYPYSAAILRSELDAVEKRFPSRKPMVVIGHSMGGCISRLLITDSGGQLWMKIFGKPPDEVPLSPHSKDLFTEELIFRHRPEVARVIFIAAPLRGSNLASSWIGRIGASLVRATSAHREAAREVLRVTDVKEGELKLKRLPNSVDTLAPNSRFVKAINTIPITPGIPYYTIIGDRGKGDGPGRSARWIWLLR